MSKQKSKKHYINYGEEYRSDAFTLYFHMGSDRSLEKLETALKENGNGKGAALSTLQKWCWKYNWQETIEKMESGKQNAAIEMMAAHAKAEEFHAKKELRDAAARVLRKALNEMEKADFEEKPDAVKGCKLMFDSVATMLREARVEEGGVSDRTAEEKTLSVDESLRAANAEADRLLAVVTKAKERRDERVTQH